MSRLKLEASPSLKNPLTVIGFGGWADAGNVSSLSILYLKESENAGRLGYIDLDDLVDHTAHRPYVTIEGGFIKQLQMPSFEIHYAVKNDRDLILLNGYELSHGWSEFISALFELMDAFGSSTLVTIGGLIDNTPHTKPLRISFLTSSQRLYARCMAQGLRPSNYTGPASMHSYIIKSSGEKGYHAMSIWGHVPSYLNIPNPRVILAVLEKLSSIMEIQLNLSRLYVESAVFEGKVNMLVENDERLKEIVKQLEKEYDEQENRPSYID
ncbi:MAG: PAC2 family protein [Candidatus Caldarchaeum sp.]|uniref:PAC2 family protein n=1 Tax=Caldiarchaeum subterraneum TaxID=311458 RepID=A0A7C5Q8L2_CALS0